MSNGKHSTGEALGMDLINQHCENILRVIGTQNMSLVDLARLKKRFHHLANILQSVINRTQKEVLDELDKLKDKHNANKS